MRCEWEDSHLQSHSADLAGPNRFPCSALCCERADLSKPTPAPLFRTGVGRKFDRSPMRRTEVLIRCSLRDMQCIRIRLTEHTK